MANINLSLSQSELTEAVRDWVEKQGFGTSVNFSVRVTNHKGDRPFDHDYTEATVSGIVARSSNPEAP